MLLAVVGDRHRSEVGVNQLPISAFLNVDPGRLGKECVDLAIAVFGHPDKIVAKNCDIAVNLYMRVGHFCEDQPACTGLQQLFAYERKPRH